MLIIEREKSMRQLCLEAILKRLPESDEGYEYFNEVYNQVRKGFEGELKADREWKELTIPSKYFLFQNLETENPFGYSHQMDTLFVCPHFLWLLEFKNISGRIDFQVDKNQFIRTRFDGTVESLRNPIDQIERHARFINGILTKLHISIPLVFSIVIIDDTTIIGAVPKRVSVFHLSGLQNKLNNLYQQYPNTISPKNMDKLKEYLIKIQKKKSWEPNLDRGKLKTGALCKNCDYKIRMNYEFGRFICPKCNTKSIDVLIEALHDYSLLYKPWITKREFSEFFGIPINSTYRIIKKLPLEAVGKNSGRVYKIPKDILKYKF